MVLFHFQVWLGDASRRPSFRRDSIQYSLLFSFVLGFFLVDSSNGASCRHTAVCSLFKIGSRFSRMQPRCSCRCLQTQFLFRSLRLPIAANRMGGQHVFWNDSSHLFARICLVRTLARRFQLHVTRAPLCCGFASSYIDRKKRWECIVLWIGCTKISPKNVKRLKMIERSGGAL